MPRIRHSEWTLIVLFVLLVLAATARAGGTVSVVPAPQAQAQQRQQQPAAGEQGDVNELVKYQQEQQKAYGAINNVNPMSAEYGKAPAPTGAAAPTGQLGQLYRAVNNPAVQGYLRFFHNPALAQGVEQIMRHPDRKLLLYVELGWLVFMFVFRIWRLSKIGVARWGAILWVNFWSLFAYVMVGYLAIPYVILGEPYLTTVQSVFR